MTPESAIERLKAEVVHAKECPNVDRYYLAVDRLVRAAPALLAIARAAERLTDHDSQGHVCTEHWLQLQAALASLSAAVEAEA